MTLTLSIEFPFGWSVNFGFSAVSNEGVNFKLVNRGLFFWRKLFIYENEKELGFFKLNRCLQPYNNIWMDRRRKFYQDSNLLTCLMRSKVNHGDGREEIFTWELNRDDIETYIFCLILMSIQGHANVAGGNSYKY